MVPYPGGRLVAWCLAMAEQLRHDKPCISGWRPRRSPTRGKKLLLVVALTLAPVVATAQQRWTGTQPGPPATPGPSATSRLPSYYGDATLLGRHGDWEVYATFSPMAPHRLMICVMLSPTSDGAMVEMDYYPGTATLRTETVLKARDAKWQLDPEETDLGGVEFGFSGSGNSWSGVADIERQAMVLGIADPLNLLSAFRRGGTVTFSARQYWRDWSLAGAAEAVADMMRCIQNHPN